MAAPAAMDFPARAHRFAGSPLVLALLFLVALLLALEFSHPGFFLHDDNATWFGGAYLHDFRTLAQTGRLAEVNYYQYGGEPFLQQGQTGVLYPPVYVGTALAELCGDARWTIEWLAALHLLLGVAGFAAWLRQGGLAPAPAALAGLAWVLNPFVLIVGSSWITVLYLAAWLPWIFWALDRLLARPDARSALALGGFVALLTLSGYPQWTAYTLLFLAFYGAMQMALARPASFGAIAFHLLVAALVFVALTAPLLLPMWHATEVSAMRAHPLSVVQALAYRVTKEDLLRAQVGLFRPHLVFGISTAILYGPALLALPLMLWRFLVAENAIRRRLFPLLLLALAALALASRWHALLTLTPLFERFRWPFKVFVFADFFSIAALAWTVATFARSREANPVARVISSVFFAFVLAAELAVGIGTHAGNSFSQTTLASSKAALPPGMDPTLGRVIAIDDLLPEASAARYFTHGYSTFYAVPNLGGYDPLVGRDQLRFGQGLDFPNVFTHPITAEIRQPLDAHAVRYWIVDPRSPLLSSVEAEPALRLLETAPDRLVYENLEALPLVIGPEDTALPVRYAGNSLLITLDHRAGTVRVTVGPTDGWRYRVDGGPWRRAPYRDDRLIVPVVAAAGTLEISYFDHRFRRSLWVSLVTIAFLLAILWLRNHFTAAGRRTAR